MGTIIYGTLGLPALICLAPFAYGLFMFSTFVIVFLGKWLLCGRLKPDSPITLFSTKFMGWNLLSSLQRYAASLGLSALQGSDYMSGYWTLMGAKVGYDTYIDTMDLLEYDLVQIGDGVVIGDDALLTCLQITPKSVSFAPIVIEDDASIGSKAVLLPGSIIEKYAIIGASATALDGEVMTTEHYWEGSPAVGKVIQGLYPASLTNVNFNTESIVPLDPAGIFNTGRNTPKTLSLIGRDSGSAASSIILRPDSRLSVVQSSRRVMRKNKAPLLRVVDVQSSGVSKPLGNRARSGPQNIFITGATGFIGCYLLERLISEGHQLYCLVRAPSKESALVRIKDNLNRYGIWKSSFEYGIIPVCGDISVPLMGLDLETWSHLAVTMDFVVHCAAEINYSKVTDYEQMP
jgi:carbonic anhydrase/acetyltransferase-like protein (isoleucine patch superfamily)